MLGHISGQCARSVAADPSCHSFSIPEVTKLQSFARLQEFLAQSRRKQRFGQFVRALGSA